MYRVGMFNHCSFVPLGFDSRVQTSLTVNHGFDVHRFDSTLCDTTAAKWAALPQGLMICATNGIHHNYKGQSLHTPAFQQHKGFHSLSLSGPVVTTTVYRHACHMITQKVCFDRRLL